MYKLMHCLDCRRIFNGGEQCQYCKSNNIRELLKDSQVNILGTKLKAKVIKIHPVMARLLITGENNIKYIKEYEIDKLRKIL